METTSLRIRLSHIVIASAAALALLAAEMIALAPRADAAHHLVRIRQVFPGSSLASTSEFVVLQLTAAGENQLAAGPLGTATVRFFNSTTQTHFGTFAMNPPNGENQRTVLVATADAEATFTVDADLQLSNVNALNEFNGAVCLDSTGGGGIDCVEWGAIGTAAMLPSNTGTLEPAFVDGEMLVRSIASGCPTLHEFGDDTDQSAADFAPEVVPMGFVPRNNAAAITETTCTPPAGPLTPATPPLTSNPSSTPKKCKKGFVKRKGKCKKKRKKK